ncbi:MAG: hypothetical protein LC792_00200 [Actinobacteria bacterium]|nr:hypothetical protein [Actinomycetota bacterium]
MTINQVDRPSLMNELEDARRAIATLRAERPELTRLSNRQLFDRARTIIDRWSSQLLADHTFVSEAAMIPAAAVLAAGREIDDTALALRAIGALGDVDSAAPAWALWRLGRLVAGSSLLSAAFDRGTDELLAGLVDAGEEGVTFLDGFAGFLYEFGSRGPDEWDLSAPTWETHPELALAAIDRLRFAPQRGAWAERPGQLPGHEDVVAAARRLIPARDRAKATIVRMQHEARMPLYEIGRRMVEEGHLDRVADFGLLTFDEFPRFLDDPASFTDTVRLRRAGRDGSPQSGSGLSLARSGETLRAVPACPGRATGTVRIVSNPADPTNLRPGDVLVTPLAGPAWVPLFLSAGAVVVEVGSSLSHAAVDSREFGVPTVVGCAGATVRLIEGTPVTVDGAAGTVTIG